MKKETFAKAQSILKKLECCEKYLVVWQMAKDYSSKEQMLYDGGSAPCLVPHVIPFAEMRHMAIEHYSAKIKELKKEFEAL